MLFQHYSHFASIYFQLERIFHTRKSAGAEGKKNLFDSLCIAIYDYISPETTRFIMRWNVAGIFLNPNSLTVHEYNCGFTHKLCTVFEVRTCCTLEKPTSDVFTAMMNFLVSGTGAACRRQNTWLPSAGWEFTGHELISRGCSCTSHWFCSKLQHIC